MAYVSADRSGASHFLAARWQRFAEWYLSGLKEVVPPGWLDWADGEAIPRVTMRPDGDTILCRLTSATATGEARLPSAGFDPTTLADWGAAQGLKREQVI